MSVWSVPRPGATRTRMPLPGGTAAAVPAAAGTRLLARRPGGSHWRTARPGGTLWAHVPQPPLPSLTEVRAALFTTEATLSVASYPALIQTGEFLTEATLSVDATTRIALDAALAAEGTLSLEVQVVGQVFENPVDLAGEGTLSVESFPRLGPNAAPFAAEGTLSVESFPRLGPHAAPLAADGTLSVSSFPRFAHTAPLAAEGTLSVESFPRLGPNAAPFAAEGTLSVAVQLVPVRSADFAGTGTLSVSSFPRFGPHAAALAGEGTLSVVVSVVQKTDWTDNFDRANGALGSNWTTFALGADTTVVPEINSNQLRAKSTATNNQNNQCFALATASAALCLTNDMATRGQMMAGENGLFLAPMVRCSSDGQNFVMGVITSDSNNTGIWTRIGGTYARRTTSSTTAFAANDYFELQASGSVYTLVRNPQSSPSTISTWTDVGGLYPTGVGKRYGGIYHNSDRNAFGTQNWGPAVDNFRVRDL